MNRIESRRSRRETAVKIIFLLLPTLLLSFFLLWNANEFYAVVLQNQAWRQTLYFGLGMLFSALFYRYQFRFLPFLVLLILGLYIIGKGIDLFTGGEFDTFFISVQFLIFSILFVAGWIVGWGFTRLRYFSILMAALFLVGCIILLSRQNDLFFILNKKPDVKDYAFLFGPAILYCLYIIFTTELIYRYRNFDGPIWWSLSKRLVGFLALAIIFLLGVLYFQKDDIKTTLADFGGGKKGTNKSDLLKKEQDGKFDLKDAAKLGGHFNRNNQLLFAAHINHFFPNSKVPNPLYMTAFYYTKFDTATQTFERDSLLPHNDLFDPDVKKISLYSTLVDSTVLKDALHQQDRKSIDLTVYKVALSKSRFVAPNIGYWVQPITVEKDFKDKFYSAYRAKSYISELNSAYFVYNTKNPIIRQFQQQRYQVLRQVKGYQGIDPAFMKYYTKMPKGFKYSRIQNLADSLAKGNLLPIEKVLAIRNYFWKKDANGNPVFSYTDNPGLPDIPNASLLKNFLFNTHKGYCAYYAGATLFLFRAMGLPSRIAVGFMTVNRSSKNPGWYWFYAKQAHAWVQVFFPGYGWLDFDTTVDNGGERRQSPKPDGTPPLQPPKAYLAAKGVIIKIDTIDKTAVLQTGQYVFHDKEYHLKDNRQLFMDLSLAAIQKDTLSIPLKQVHPGDSATAVSYATAFKNINAGSKTAAQLMKTFPKPAPIDELHVKKQTKETKPSKTKAEQQAQQPTSWLTLIYWIAGALLFIVLCFLLFPWLAYRYYKTRQSLTKSIEKRTYFTFRTAGYFLHVVYKGKKEGTYLQYAQQADKYYDTEFSNFMTVYLKLKYSGKKLSTSEQNIINHFLPGFLKKVKQNEPFKKRLAAFLKIFHCIGYWSIIEKRQ